MPTRYDAGAYDSGTFSGAGPIPLPAQDCTPTYAGQAFGASPYAACGPVGGGPGVTINGGLYPLEVIEIAPGYGPFVVSPTWTDITADVRKWRTNRGRQHELNRVEPGSVEVTIDNRSGPYYPFNTTGPYYPNLNPGMQLRIRSVYGGKTWPVYHGTVESIHPNWEAVNDTDITFTCKDRYKYSALKKVTSLAYYQTVIQADAPAGWWRLNDAALVQGSFSGQVGSTTIADSSGNGHTGTIYDYTGFDESTLATFSETRNWAQQDAPLLAADTTASTFFGWKTNGGGQIAINTNMAPDGGGSIPQALTFEAWVRIPNDNGTASGAGGTIMASQYGSSRWVALSVSSSQVGFSGPTEANAPTAAGIPAGSAHHIVGTMTADALPVQTIYVDGVQVATATATAGFLGGSLGNLIIGGENQLSGANPKTLFTGNIQEAAVYNYVLTPAQVLNHYRAGSQPRYGELTGARMQVLASAVGFDSSQVAIDAGNSQLQGADNSLITDTVQAHQTKVTDTEGGVTWIDATGTFQFWDRFHSSRTPYNTVVVTLGDNFAGGEEPYIIESIDLQRDDLDVYNDVVITPNGMAAQRVGNTTSQANAGVRTLSKNTLHLNTSDALNQATFLLNKYLTALDRIRSVTFTPTSNPNVLFPVALGVDLFARVAVMVRPKDATGTVLTQTALVEGIEHDVSAEGLWKTTWRLSPTDAVIIMIFNDPNTTFGNAVFGY